MANPDEALRPGLFARVDLGISTRPGVAVIPEDAVLQRADGAVVFLLGEDSRVERRVIELGSIRGGTVEVQSGVVPGDLVVLHGQSRLVDGDLVVIRDGDLIRDGVAFSGVDGEPHPIADAREPSS